MRAKPQLSPYITHLGQPEVHALIESHFPPTLQPADRKDLVQQTLASAMQAVSPPANPDAWAAFDHKIANDTLANHFRVEATHAKYNVGLVDNADDYAGNAKPKFDPPPRVELGQVADWWDRLVERGEITPRQSGILVRVLEGTPQPKIAKELGLARATVRNEAYEARKKLRLALAGGTGVTALVAMAAMFCLVTSTALVGSGQRTSSPSTPIPSPAISSLERQRASGLRDQARQDHDARRWSECLDRLNDAAALDPTGDLAPITARLRSECLQFVDPHATYPREERHP